MSIPESHTDALASSDTNSTNGNSLHQGPSLPPEILLMILRNLPPESLVHCTLVNREFNRVTTPLVWSSHYDQQTMTKFVDSGYRQSLAKNAHHIRSFEIRSECTLDFFCPTLFKPEAELPPRLTLRPIELPHLQELMLDFEDPIQRNNQEPQVDYPRVLKWLESSFLHSLHILHIRDYLSPEIAIDIAHSRQLRLTKILLRTHLNVAEATYFLSNLPSQVQSLNLEIISYRPEFRTYEDKQPFTTNHHALRSLYLDCYCDSDEYDLFLVPFLATCSSNLKCCRTDHEREILNINVRLALENLGMHEKRFDDDRMENALVEDKEIANEISVFSSLQVVSITNLRKVGPRTMVTLLPLTETLRMLELPNYAFITSAEVVLMLSSLKRLETFGVHGPTYTDRYDGYANGVYPPCNLYLTAAQVLSIEWATQSLESFICPILVPRSKSHVPEKYRIADLTCEKEESWAIQRQVYRRLAEQSNLVDLCFGVNVEYSKYELQWYSLEMTLNSGIDELDMVRNLEDLQIYGLNHNMKEQDTQWMKEMWSGLMIYSHKNKIMH